MSQSLSSQSSPETASASMIDSGSASVSSDVLLNKLLEANRYEQTGDLERARFLYQEIVQVDAEGTWGQSAQKALGNLPPDSQVETSAAQVLGGAGAIASEEQHGTTSRSRTMSSFGAREHNYLEPDGDLDTPTLILEETRRHSRGGTRGALRSHSAKKIAASQAWLAQLSVNQRLRLALLGAAIVPSVVISAATLWWLPSQRLPTGQTALSTEQQIISQEFEILLVQQRWVALLAGGLAVGVGFLAFDTLTQSVSLNLTQLAKLLAQRLRGKAMASHPIEAQANEIGDLARQLRVLVSELDQRDQRLLEVSRAQQDDLQRAQQETQRLQQQVIELLVQIEEVRSGNLTARAPIVDGKMGSISDAFNATVDSLRYIVTQVVNVTDALTQGATRSEASVRQVSTSALDQSEALKAARQDVAAMVDSIAQVTKLATEVVEIARQAAEAAQSGDVAMNQTVVSMDNIRTAVSNTSKKAKRLAESAQEVSQILAVVSGISEKANLLAFNASIEAARAGEQGQGFRQVADEVRGLAVQVSESAQDIERLVQSIQEETAEVIDVLEVGTAEVVSGTQLVNQTQQTLSHLTELSQTIDHSLQSVAEQTIQQTETSTQVNQAMKSVAEIALANAEATQDVVSTLQKLLREMSTLKASVDRFQI